MLASKVNSASIVSTLRAAGCVFAEDEAELLIASAGSPAELTALVDRRVAGLPLEYVVGWAEFCGLRIAVEPGVFVPRRRTELLVSEAAAVLLSGGKNSASAPQDGTPDRIQAGPHATVLDLGCGSGAVGAALRSVADIELYAVDIDPVAVRCARRNVGSAVFLGDLYEPLPAAIHGQVDVIVANAPYVPTAAIRLLPAEAREYEHWAALDGGPDGLDVLRRVITGAPSWLVPGGHLLIESSEDQAASMAEAMDHCGLRPRICRSEDLGATVVAGQRGG
jgi:release factor glutamine methyltransferase